MLSADVTKFPFLYHKCLSIYLIFSAYLIYRQSVWTPRPYQITSAIVLQLTAIAHLCLCFHCYTCGVTNYLFILSYLLFSVYLIASYQ